MNGAGCEYPEIHRYIALIRMACHSLRFHFAALQLDPNNDSVRENIRVSTIMF